VPAEEAPKPDRTIRAWLQREHADRVRRWMVIGMFPNAAEDGHDAPLPPEEQVDLMAVYPGWYRTAQWTPWHSMAEDDHHVDLDHALSPWHYSGPVWEPGTAYAYAEFYSPERGAATLELGLQDATKVWINGRLFHTSSDAYPVGKMETIHCAAYLRQGKNTVLVKVSSGVGPCQFRLDLLSTDSEPLPITWWK